MVQGPSLKLANRLGPHLSRFWEMSWNRDAETASPLPGPRLVG